MTQFNNQDAENVKHFNSLADEWWDPNGPMKTLHWINPTRLEFIKKHSSLADKKTLDVGCGAGLLSEELAKAGASVAGIDMAADLIEVALQHSVKNNLQINYQHDNIENYAALHPETFDIITCLELIEHVPDPQAVITACSKALKPGGLFFISTINRNLQSFVEDIVAAEYILKLVPKGSHTYAQFIKPSELSNMCATADLQTFATNGFKFNFCNNTFRLSKSLSTNYIMVAKKCR
jgi:2-polyprenyl-6-hydroxyphenyl methylase/3-demethylubiquinone-9 3-methyltransferase